MLTALTPKVSGISISALLWMAFTELHLNKTGEAVITGQP